MCVIFRTQFIHEESVRKTISVFCVSGTGFKIPPFYLVKPDDFGLIWVCTQNTKKYKIILDL